MRLRHHALIWVVGFAAVIGVAVLLVLHGKRTAAASAATPPTPGAGDAGATAGYASQEIIINSPSGQQIYATGNATQAPQMPSGLPARLQGTGTTPVRLRY